jgi:dTDP-4-amino-4,6-dideoxygalactose transaminase
VFDREEDHDRATKMRALGIDSSAWSRLEAKRPWQYDVVSEGFRYHMPNFCAAIGLSQLERFEEFKRTKQDVLARYQDGLREHPLLGVPEMPVERVFPFIALVLVEERDRFMAHMKQAGVGTGVHYAPVHWMTRFADCAADGLPESDRLGHLICSLPLLNDQSDAECERVLEAAASFS